MKTWMAAAGAMVAMWAAMGCGASTEAAPSDPSTPDPMSAAPAGDAGDAGDAGPEGAATLPTETADAGATPSPDAEMAPDAGAPLAPPDSGATACTATSCTNAMVCCTAAGSGSLTSCHAACPAGTRMILPDAGPSPPPACTATSCGAGFVCQGADGCLPYVGSPCGAQACAQGLDCCSNPGSPYVCWDPAMRTLYPEATCTP